MYIADKVGIVRLQTMGHGVCFVFLTQETKKQSAQELWVTILKQMQITLNLLLMRVFGIFPHFSF
jgi:hypothetical protein